MYMPKSKSKSPPTNPVRSSEWWKSPKGADPWDGVNSNDFDPETQAERIQKRAEEYVIKAAKSLDKDDSFFNPKSSQSYVPSKSPPDYVPLPPSKNELQLPNADGRTLIDDHEKTRKRKEIKAIVTSVRNSIEEDIKKQDIWNKTKYKARKGNLKAIFKVLGKNVSRKLYGKGGKSIRRSRKQRK
mgnify:CR=1 FL=1